MLRLERIALGLILASALILRLSALDVFLTTDENFWAQRSLNFREAVARGDWSGTYQSPHPGVVTMWLGALGTPLADAADRLGIARAISPAPADPVSARFPQITLDARRLVAVLTWAGIVVVYFLLRQVFNRRTALLAAALLALDPAYLALSRVHHLDALLATFMLVSAASLLVFVNNRQRRYLVMSAVAGGLAIANKSPGLFLIPWVGMVLLAAAWGTRPALRRPRLMRAAGDGLVWGILAGGVVVAIWPALWVDPAGTMSRVLAGALGYAQTPHEYMNFFWSEAVPDPGPLFYPVSWLFRAMPVVIAGLAGLVLAARRPDLRGPAAALLVLGCGYAAFMTLGSKKLEKYILPSYLMLDVLAAVGWGALLDRVVPRLRPGWSSAAVPSLMIVLAAGSQIALLAPTYPYYFPYYNPLVGGAHAAPQILRVGYGECLDRAAAYLNAKPGAPGLRVATTNVSEFGPFFSGQTLDAGAVSLAEPDYYALYLPHIQRWLLPRILEHFQGAQQPEAVVSCAGIDYVWIYRNTFYRSEVAQALDYVDQHAESEREGIILDVDAAWSREYRGSRPVTPIAGPARPDFVLTGLQKAAAGGRIWLLTFPDPPGDTRKLINRFLKEQGQRVDEVKFGEVRAAAYKLRDGARFLPPGPGFEQEVRLGEHLRLLGYDLPTSAVTPGEPFAIRFYWQAGAPETTSYTVFTHLIGPDGKMYGQLDSPPQGGGRPTSTWLPGETIVDDYTIQVAPGAPPGDYRLAVGMYDVTTTRRLPAVDATGKRLSDDQVVIEGLRQAH